MTERAMGQRSAAGRFVWLAVAVLAIGGFMAWLGMSTRPGTVAVVEEQAEAAVDFSAAEAVTLESLAAAPTSYLDRAIRLDGLPVSSLLGSEAFWAVAPNGMPFLIKLGESLLESGFAVRDGETLTAVGQVREMSEAVLDAWEQGGVLRSSDDRLMAEFATAYLEIVQAEHRVAEGPISGGE